MYSIYFLTAPSDGIADIYKNGKDDMELVYSNGYFSDTYRVVNPKFSKTLGSAGELTFTMLPSDKIYKKATRDELNEYPLFQPARTYVYIYDSNLSSENDDGTPRSQCMWRGRIASVSEDFYGNKSITCEGELSFINDVIFPPYSYGFHLADNDPVMTHKFHQQNPYDMFRAFTRYYNRHVTKDLFCSWKTFWYVNRKIMDPHDENGERILDPDQNTLYKYEQAIWDTWADVYKDGDTRKYLQALAGLDYELVQDLININEKLAPWMPGYTPITPNDICRKMAKTALSTEYQPLMDVYQEHLCTDNEPSGYLEFDYGPYEEITNRGEANNGATISGKYRDVDFFPRLNYFKYDDISRRIDQTIMFGNNLLNLDTDLDTTNVYTIVTPLGAPMQRFRCRCHEGWDKNVHIKPAQDVEDNNKPEDLSVTIRISPNGDADKELKKHMRWYHPKLTYSIKTDGDKTKTKMIGDMSDEELSGIWSDVKDDWLVDEGTERMNISEANSATVNGTKSNFQYIPTPNNWEDDTLIQQFGLKGKIIEFDDVDDPYKLMCLGVKYRKYAGLIDSITVSALDLKTLGVDVDPIQLGYSIRVISPIHNIDTYMQCTAINLDFDNVANNTYTFGKTVTGISDKQVKINRRTIKG